MSVGARDAHHVGWAAVVYAVIVALDYVHQHYEFQGMTTRMSSNSPMNYWRRPNHLFTSVSRDSCLLVRRRQSAPLIGAFVRRTFS